MVIPAETQHNGQRCDVKAQKDHECRHRRLLMEEGSENENEEQSDEEQGIDKEDAGTQVGHPNILCSQLWQFTISSVADPSPQSLVQCSGSALHTATAKSPR